MGWSGFLKGISATVLASVLIGGGGFLAVQYLINQYSAPPPKPTFSNDAPPAKAKPPVEAAKAGKPSPKPEAAKPSPSPSPKPSGTEYRARITLAEGLNLRQSPDVESDRVDGVDYSDEVTVLEESPDKEWMKVRVISTGAEGWIKSGYTERSE